MKSNDPFIQKHLNRILVIQAALGSKRLFVQCFPTDFDAYHFPNSNFAVKEIFLSDEYPEVPSKEPNVQASVATDDDSSTEAGQQKQNTPCL